MWGTDKILGGLVIIRDLITERTKDLNSNVLQLNNNLETTHQDIIGSAVEIVKLVKDIQVVTDNQLMSLSHRVDTLLEVQGKISDRSEQTRTSVQRLSPDVELMQQTLDKLLISHRTIVSAQETTIVGLDSLVSMVQEVLSNQNTVPESQSGSQQAAAITGSFEAFKQEVMNEIRLSSGTQRIGGLGRATADSDPMDERSKVTASAAQRFVASRTEMPVDLHKAQPTVIPTDTPDNDPAVGTDELGMDLAGGISVAPPPVSQPVRLPSQWARDQQLAELRATGDAVYAVPAPLTPEYTANPGSE